MAPVPALIGENGRIDLAASMHGQDLTLSRLQVNGKALTISANGGMTDQVVNLDWAVALADLGAIQPDLSGTMDAKGHAGGKLDDLAVNADIGADLAAKGYNSGHITARVDATGLPKAPHATVNAEGTLLDAPLSLALTAEQVAGSTKVNISQASWKSLQAGGDLILTPPAIIPAGNLHIDMTRLADLQPLLGRAVAGQANATLDSNEKAARLNVTLRDAALPGTAAISKAALNATVTDPSGSPSIDGTFSADGIAAGPVKSDLGPGYRQRSARRTRPHRRNRLTRRGRRPGKLHHRGHAECPGSHPGPVPHGGKLETAGPETPRPRQFQLRRWRVDGPRAPWIQAGRIVRRRHRRLETRPDRHPAQPARGHRRDR